MNNQLEGRNQRLNKTHKLSNAEFWTILRDNGGLFARTAKAIERKYKISFSRSAVKQRADTEPHLLNDIIEESLDIAEEGILFLMKQKGDIAVQLNAIKYYLNKKGASRGYGERAIELNATAGAVNNDEACAAAVSLTIKIAE